MRNIKRPSVNVAYAMNMARTKRKKLAETTLAIVIMRDGDFSFVKIMYAILLCVILVVLLWWYFDNCV